MGLEPPGDRAIGPPRLQHLAADLLVEILSYITHESSRLNLLRSGTKTTEA